MKIIEVIADAGNHDTIASIAEQHKVEDIWFGANNEDGPISARLLVSPENRQSVLAVGVILAIVTAALLGLVWPSDLYSRELMLRTDVTYSDTAIALASGAAALLSLVTITSSVLVGV